MTTEFRESVNYFFKTIRYTVMGGLERRFLNWQGWMHGRRSARMIRRQINGFSEWFDYLERFHLLQLPFKWFSVFLHRFWLNDPDPLHCHPWPWGRLIVWGRYREHYIDGTYRDFGPGHVVWRRDAMAFHRVELLSDYVWTVFWHWRRCRQWGFLQPSGEWVPAEEVVDAEKRPTVGWLFPRKG